MASRFIRDLIISCGKEKEVLFEMVKLRDEVNIKEIEISKVEVHLKSYIEKNHGNCSGD